MNDIKVGDKFVIELVDYEKDKLAEYFKDKSGTWLNADMIKKLPKIPKSYGIYGKWLEKDICSDSKFIEEWQSTKCSECGRYHTTPYLYYFDEYNYCPYCGARMNVRVEDRNESN